MDRLLSSFSYRSLMSTFGFGGTAFLFFSFVILTGVLYAQQKSEPTNSGRNEPTEAIADRHRTNINSLKSLLQNDGVFLSEMTLLASPEKSQMLLVNLKSSGRSISPVDGSAANTAQRSLISLNERRIQSVKPIRSRAVEISTTRLLVAALNNQNQVLWWQFEPDPRILRYETADENNNLSGQTFNRGEANILLTVPDDEAITSLRFYQPVWENEAYALKAIGDLNLSEVNK